MKEKEQKSKHRTAKQMYAYVTAWEQSGQSQREFIAGQGLSKSVFGYWLRRYRAERGGRSTPVGGFVAVALPAGPGKEVAAPGLFARVEYADGRVLLLHMAVTSQYLRELLA